MGVAASASAATAPRSRAGARRYLRAYWPPMLYGALALVIAAPLLTRGFVLAVDIAQTPRSPLLPAYWGLPSGTNEGSLGRLPIDGLFSLAGQLGVVDLAQKALLLAIPLLAGLGMHRVVPARSTPARLFAGLLYAVNPFVADRLATGQWLLLLGYALLPWAYGAFLASMRGDRRAVWRFALLAGITGAAGAHMAVLLALLCLVTLACTDRGRRAGAAALGAGLLASLLWLIPAPGLRELWQHVGGAQLDLYGTRADPTWGPVVGVLGLHGYWNSPLGRTPVAMLPAAVAALLVLALCGAALARPRRVAIAVALTGVAGALFAIGMASPLTRSPLVFLMDHLPALRSFRDTQKTAALVVFAYAFLGAATVDQFVRRPPRRAFGRAFVVALVALPLVSGFSALRAARDSLHSVQFPVSWQAADRILARHAASSRTLFLPFHGYLHLGFARSRVTYNPAPAYFSTPILSSRSVSPDPRLNDVSDPQERLVESLLADPLAPRVGRCLAALGVSHILLAHEADWRAVSAIALRPDVRVVAAWPNLTLLSLRRPGAATMTAPAAAGGTCPAGLQPLPSRWQTPAHLRLAAAVPPGRRLVLGVPRPAQWRVQGADVRFAAWPAYRRIYAIGLAGWLVVIGGALAAAVVHRRDAFRPRRPGAYDDFAPGE